MCDVLVTGLLGAVAPPGPPSVVARGWPLSHSVPAGRRTLALRDGDCYPMETPVGGPDRSHGPYAINVPNSQDNVVAESRPLDTVGKHDASELSPYGSSNGPAIS